MVASVVLPTLSPRAVRVLIVASAAVSAAACAAPSSTEVDARPPPPIDGPADPWATYTILPGQQSASVTGGGDGNPLRNIVEVGGRDYRFAFDASAAYVLTTPVEPQDQYDWNKLPGLSDCENADLSRNGAMFGWRWRVDTEPRFLEVTAYANNDGVHLQTDVMLTLSADELASETPLRYRFWLDGAVYRFEITGTIGRRTIGAGGELPRVCTAIPATATKWAAGLYFGGTSVAPHQITGRISEQPFRAR